jgi:predicted PurR-regulated permease PerM
VTISGDPVLRDAGRPLPSADTTLQIAGRIAWHLVGIGILLTGLIWLVWQLRVVVFPLFIAVLLASVLAPISRALCNRGAASGLAAAVPVLALVIGLGVAGVVIVPAIADQVDDLRASVTDGLDRFTDWVDRVEPLGLDGSDVDALRRNVTSATPDGDTLAAGARTAGMILAGTILALIATFFFIRDRRRMVTVVVDRLPGHWRDDAWTVARSVERSLVGYVRGAAVLGLVEGTAIGVAVTVVGGELAIVLAVLTFLGAFVPFVGAAVSGVLAAGVTFAVAGTVPGLIVAGVAIVVQQVDNDLLAPVIYGRFMRLHPLVVLASLAVGIEVAGLIGAIAAVPVAATIAAVVRVGQERTTRSRLGLGDDLRPLAASNDGAV